MMDRIEDVAEVFNGKTPSKNEQRVKGIPILKIRDIDANGKFNGKFGSFVDEKFYKKHSRKRLKPGDTIILNAAHNTNYVGNKNAIVGDDLDGILATGEWLIVRPIKIDPFFLNSYLKSFEGKQKIRNEVKGIHLYPRDVQRIKIPFPSPNEQIRIATLLSKIESLIAKRKKSIAYLDELLKSIFMEMFGDPVRNEKGWEKIKIGEMATIRIGPFGSLLHAEDYVKDGIPLINPSHIIAGKIVPDNNLSLSLEKYMELKNYHLKRNDVVVARRGEIGRCALVETNKRLFCGTGSMFIRISNGYYPNFLQFQIYKTSLKDFLESKSKGVTMKNLNSKILSQLKILNPPLELQTQFASIIEKVETIKQQYFNSLDDLGTLYGALSQKAFKGELELSRITPGIEIKADPISFDFSFSAGFKSDSRNITSSDLEKVIKKYELDVFSFDELWNKVTKSFEQSAPQRNEIEKLFINLLEKESSPMEQVFAIISSEKDKNSSSPQIAFKVCNEN